MRFVEHEIGWTLTVPLSFGQTVALVIWCACSLGMVVIAVLGSVGESALFAAVGLILGVAGAALSIAVALGGAGLSPKHFEVLRDGRFVVRGIGKLRTLGHGNTKDTEVELKNDGESVFDEFRWGEWRFHGLGDADVAILRQALRAMGVRCRDRHLNQ